MNRRLGVVAGTAGLALALVVPASAAFAETSSDYPGGTTPPSVLGENLTQGEVSPASAAQTAPASSTLPVTGGDIAELAGVGVLLIAGGTVLVRRSRSARRTATATA